MVEQLALHRLVTRFVSGDSKIVADIRPRFGTKPGRGDEIIAYVTNEYINNNSKSEAKAKEDLKKFNYADITSKEGNPARDFITAHKTIKDLLDASVQGDDKVGM